jgi:hypothetical protein
MIVVLRIAGLAVAALPLLLIGGDTASLAAGHPNAAAALGAPAARNPSHSRLWGADGDQWDPRGRLPDFSYAGYQGGGKAIPDVAAVRDMKRDFGAKGDGRTDDTAAFLRAIQEAPDGALFIPRGRYVIQRDLRIERSRLVLRGEGPDKTVLYFTKSLTDLYGPNREWSWTGGMIDVGAWGKDWFLTTVSAPAKRGDRMLKVSVPSRVQPGMMIVLRLTDDAQHTLWNHAHNEQAAYPQITTCMPMNTLDWMVQVDAVDVESKTITLHQPLRADVRPDWSPTIYRPPYIDEIGIEQLGIEFPPVPYSEHNQEPGYNAIYFRNYVGNSWVRNVSIFNADSAIHVTGSKWITVTGITIDANRPPRQPGFWYGHHGLHSESSEDILFEYFIFKKNFQHELGVEHQNSGSVFHRGGGTGFSNDPRAGPNPAIVADTSFDLDHHRGWPFENLFTNLTVPVSFNSSGNLCFGPHSGARATFWNVPGDFAVPPESGDWWVHIQATIVGELPPGMQEALTAGREWYEHVPGLEPADLYEAQWARPLKRGTTR